MRVVYFLSIISSLFCTGVICSTETTNKIGYSMPINFTTPERYNLSVTIPEGYQTLQPASQFGESSTGTIEYVLQNESSDGWSRTIALMKVAGGKLAAGKFADDVKNAMSKQARNVRVLEYHVTKGQFFEKAVFALSYDYHSKHEVIAGQYYSGPFDLTGVQYTLRLARGQSDASALEEIHAYFNTYVSVIN